jgi:hypothetical protein
MRKARPELDNLIILLEALPPRQPTDSFHNGEGSEEGTASAAGEDGATEFTSAKGMSWGACVVGGEGCIVAGMSWCFSASRFSR